MRACSPRAVFTRNCESVSPAASSASGWPRSSAAMLTRPGPYELKRPDPESPEFQALVEESRLEGYWMLVRLADGWRDGRNRFRRRGEMLVAAWQDGALAG